MRYENSIRRKQLRRQEGDHLSKFGAYLRQLEQTAAEKGHVGLAIALSIPFQRLLIYPAMFQKLLFYTDPSSFEYERTLQMVVEVEAMVRSIKDEKVLKEESDKMRDVLRRIDGLEKVKPLSVPKPSRILMEEHLVTPTGPSSSGIGGRNDLWLIVFNDAVLRCRRTGITFLPIGDSMSEIQGKSRFAIASQKNSHAKPRNLYKFIKVALLLIMTCLVFSLISRIGRVVVHWRRRPTR